MTNMDILKIIIENVNEEGYCPYVVNHFLFVTH